MRVGGEMATTLTVIIFLLAILLFQSSVKIVAKGERMVVFRLGRFTNIVEPGFALVIPFLDKGVKVNLGEKIPEWEALSKDQLVEEIRRLPEIDVLIGPG